MTPLSEFSDLVSRSRALFSAILLTLICTAMLAVAFASCICAVWISVFTSARIAIDRQAARIKAPKEVAI